MRTRLAVLWVAWTVLLGGLISLALWAGQRAGIIWMHSALPLRTSAPRTSPVVPWLIDLIELLAALVLLFVLYLPPLVITARWRRRA